MTSFMSAPVWLSVVEALASSKQVDASVLKELVKKVPEITGDLGKDVREMIYFRVLDTLASQRIGRNGSVSPAPISEHKFNPSESFEDVVNCMLHEGTNDAEMYKLQLQNFITQKRTILPKCTLQELKDAILEGKHPAIASFKARSRLSTSSKSNQATGFSDGKIVAIGKNSTSPNAENLNGQTVAKRTNLTSPNSENFNGQTVSKGKISTSPNAKNLNGQTATKGKNSTPSNVENLNGQTVTKGKNSTPPNVVNLNGFSQENCQQINLNGQTCEIESNDQNLRSRYDSSNLDSGVDTNFPVTKKLKHNASLNGQAVSHECHATVRDKSAEALGDELELSPSVNERKDGGNYYANMGTSNAASAPPNQAHINSRNFYGQTVSNGKNLTSPNAENLNGQTVTKGKNSVAPNVENLNGFSQESCQHVISTHLKRDTREIGSHDQALRSHKDSSNLDSRVDTNFPVTKKLKRNASLHGQAVSHECQATVRDKSAEALVDEMESNLSVNERKDGENYYANIGTSNAASASPNQAHKNSQCTFIQDSLTFDYCSELNLCTKCEKAGDLLVCSAYACPIVVHEVCLGTEPSFDDSGKFLCPFCSYSCTTSEYLKIKEKALLMRRDLAVFMGVKNGQRPNRSSKKSTRPEQNQLTQDDGVKGNDQIHQNLVKNISKFKNRENIR